MYSSSGAAPMTIVIEPIPAPLRVDEDGTVRAGTRVILDLIVNAFWQGMSPEEIVDEYDTLKLADVYAVIAYYLDHRAEIDAYLSQRQDEAQALRTQIAANTSRPDLLRRLLA